MTELEENKIRCLQEQILSMGRSSGEILKENAILRQRVKELETQNTWFKSMIKIASVVAGIGEV